jgi:hypothetical protein
LLVPVGPWILGDLETISKLASWREKKMDSFFSDFEPTSNSMRDYLQEYSINKMDRILFLIRKNNDFLGHMGFASIGYGEAEVDNIMKSQDRSNTLSKSEFECVFRKMLSWGSGSLGLREIKLQVVSSNLPAIKLYKKTGFVETHAEDVEVSQDTTRLFHAEKNQLTPKKYRIWMRIILD